jgi:hypothetical protein
LLAGFDQNADWRIDANEMSAGIVREFARANANGDDGISPLEFGAWSALVLGGGHAPRRLDFDRNVDSAITNEEFANEIRARAGEYDANQDGTLARDELIKEAPEPSQQMQQGPGAPGRGGPPGGGRPPQR